MVRYSEGNLDWSDRELRVMEVKAKRLIIVWGIPQEGQFPEVVHEEEGWWEVIDPCLSLCSLFGYVKASRWVDVEGWWRQWRREKYEGVQEAGGEARKETFQAKRLHGKLMSDVSEVGDERLWQGLYRAGYLKRA